MTLVTTIIPHIPVRQDLLPRAIGSVQAQTHPERELLVVTDADHRGSAWAIAQGVAQSTGEWITLLGDDDWLLPEHHQQLLAAQRESGADVVYPWYQIVNAQGEEVQDFQPGRFGVPFDPESQRHAGWLAGGGSLIRGDLLRSLGIPQRGDPEFPAQEPYDDHAMYIRLMDAGAKFYHHPEKLYMWSHNGRNTSGRGDRW